VCVIVSTEGKPGWLQELEDVSDQWGRLPFIRTAKARSSVLT
jgi:hypothetical protein